MSEQRVTIVARQAAVLAERVSAFNAAHQAVVEYFAAVIDGQGLPRATEFVSIDAETGTLVVRVPDDG